MGQVQGKARIHKAVEVFTNLSQKSISRLWQSFNDFADGFGLTKPEFEEIFGSIHDDLDCSIIAMKQHARAFFELMDSDKNGLVGNAANRFVENDSTWV